MPIPVGRYLLTSKPHIYYMFSKFKHDPLPVADIVLCAGPIDRQALEKILQTRTAICNIEEFIKDLHRVVTDQIYFLDITNEQVGRELLCEKDADTSFEVHLSDLSQEDVDKVLKHLHVLFIDRCGYYTGVNELDNNLSDKERKDIYENIIVPWLRWVRSVGQNKSDTAESETNSADNKSDNIDN